METKWIPAECTLPTAEQPFRAGEFDRLLRQTAKSVERTSPERLRVNLAHDAELAATVARLAANETSCCSFFTFALTVEAANMVLDVSVPAPRADVLDALVSST